MDSIQAFVLGMVQGLTEYLPVSSSGHLAIGQYIFGMGDGKDNLFFTVAVHVATVLSTLVVLRKEVAWLFTGCFDSIRNGFKMNDEMRYMVAIIISMIPVGIVGVFFKDTVESVFGEGLMVVGCMLLLTAFLLSLSWWLTNKRKKSDIQTCEKSYEKDHISNKDAFIIGIAQACAVMPGLSRSGTTIATGLILGNRKDKLAQFSFLMVIPPILGEALLDILKAMKGGFEAVATDISMTAMIVGFISAFIFGCLACKWMINVVKKGKLIYFAIYCAVVGAITIGFSL